MCVCVCVCVCVYERERVGCGSKIWDYLCHNEPQTGNGAEVWMTSCQEDLGREFEDFEKELVEG